MKNYSFGNTPGKTCDVVIHIQEKRKYVYLFRETSKRIWKSIGRIMKIDYCRPANFQEADHLYFSLTEETS